MVALIVKTDFYFGVVNALKIALMVLIKILTNAFLVPRDVKSAYLEKNAPNVKPLSTGLVMSVSRNALWGRIQMIMQENVRSVIALVLVVMDQVIMNALHAIIQLVISNP